MSTRIPDCAEAYLRLVESDQPRFCQEQHALAELVRRVFRDEDLRVDTARLEKYLGLARYFPFRQLLPWEEFCTALWLCTYTGDVLPRWKTLFSVIGRGAGKDGYIAFSAFCGVSPYNPVSHYDVDICATNEEQAMTPVKDIIEALEQPALEAKLNKHYYHTKELVQGRKNRGAVRGRTNNPKGRDGMRTGMAVFNEVHAYENYDNIKVFVTGQGKVADPRVGIFTSNGQVNDGPLDDYIARGMRILFENEPDGGFLPFICRLREQEQVHDEANWFMANPSLAYFPHLLQETRDEYRDWLEHPEQNGDFLTKRMGLRVTFQEIAVTDYEKVLATNRPLPDLRGHSCTVGIDYAELSDWAAVDLHFRVGNERYDICHAWVCLQSKTLPRVKAPWRKWAEDGLITVVDDVSIGGDLIADYILQAGRTYSIRMLAMDSYRWTLMAESLKKAGFDAADRTKVKLVRPTDIMQTVPTIQECFDRGFFHWGDNPCLRWAVNNTKRVPSSRRAGSDTGNWYYAKIEAKSRKTDPFMALTAAMCVEGVLGNGTPPALPRVGPIIFS